MLAALLGWKGPLRHQITRLWHSATFTSWLSLLVRFGSVVVLLPIVLVRFPAAEVAVWQLFSALFVLSLMLDYAMAPTFSRLLSFARGGLAVGEMVRVLARPVQDVHARAGVARASASSIFATMRWLYPRLAVLVTLVVAVLGTWSLMKPVSELSQPAQAWTAWALVLLAMCAVLWGGAYGHALQGMNQIAPMRRWDVAFAALQMGTSVLVLSLGGGLLALVASYQAWAVLGVLRNRMLLRQLHGELFIAQPRRDPQVQRAAVPATWRTLVSVLGSQGVVQLSGVLYSQSVPIAELASYLLALRLATVVSQFAQAPFYTKLPSLSEAHAAGRPAQVLAVAARGMRFAHWVFVGGALVAASAGPHLIGMLNSHTAFTPPLVFAVLLLALFTERMAAMHMQMYSLTNHIVTHVVNGITGLLSCFGTLLFLPTFGILAFPLALLISNCSVYLPSALWYSRKAFPGDFKNFERKTSVVPLVILVSGLALTFMVSQA